MPRVPKPSQSSGGRTTIGVKPDVKNLVIEYGREGEALGETIRRAIVVAMAQESAST